MKGERDETPETREPSESAGHSREPSENPFQAGQVWWCDGTVLAFDPYYKRRPVLIVGIEAETAHVIPLSSKRRYGQETVVSHERGVSFMTGHIRPIPVSALRKTLGYWQDFPDWYESQRNSVDTQPPVWRRLTDLIHGIQKRWQRLLANIDTRA